jgi:hypothetical protein
MGMTTRLLAIAAIALGACGGAIKATATPEHEEAPRPAARAEANVGPAPTPPPSQPATAAGNPAPKTGDKLPEATKADEMVIYTGGVAMIEEPEKFPGLIDRIIDLSESMGGRLQTRRDDGVTIRVPSAHFREAMTKLDALGVVTHRSVTAEDVSEEFHDADVQLANLMATRKRLQDFLTKANDVPSTLAVERELERVSADIDRLEGRIRFLQARASMSTIDVTIAEKPRTITAVAPTAAPRPRGIALPIKWLDNLDADHLATFE